MTKEIKIGYIADKETKGTYRFKPKDDSVIGNATIYLPKSFVSENGIDPEKGFEMVILAKE